MEGDDRRAQPQQPCGPQYSRRDDTWAFCQADVLSDCRSAARGTTKRRHTAGISEVADDQRSLAVVRLARDVADRRCEA